MVDLWMVNNPLTKKHLYRQHVLYKLNSLKVLDGKDVYSDEKERISILFLHERATAAASGAASTVGERVMDNRTAYQAQLVLTPSSIPNKCSSSASTSQTVGIPYNEVLTGSLLRKTLTTPTPPPILSAPTFPPPEHEVDLSIATRSLLAPTHHSNRNLSSLGGQSSWQVGSINPGTATVASALSANLAKSVGTSGLEQLYGSSLRRRLTSVHYDQQQNGEYSTRVHCPSECPLVTLPNS